MMTIRIPSNEEKIALASRVFNSAFDNGMKTSKVIEILTLPGEQPITRQTVFGYRKGLNKPLTDRLLDVYAYSDDPTAKSFCLSVLHSMWPEIEFNLK